MQNYRMENGKGNFKTKSDDFVAKLRLFELLSKTQTDFEKSLKNGIRRAVMTKRVV
jgi:hypothetical protein